MSSAYVVLEIKQIHKPNIFLIYGKWYQHIVRYWLLVNRNVYHHIIWKRVSGFALLCCGIVENVCALVRGEEGPGVPIPCNYLVFLPQLYYSGRLFDVCMISNSWSMKWFLSELRSQITISTQPTEPIY